MSYRIIGNLIFLFIILASLGGFAQDTVYVRKAGTLSSMLSTEKQDSCTMLIVIGKLNAADLKLLRKMAGYNENGFKTGRLKYLSLKDCSFVKDKEPFMVLDARKEHLSGTALPAVVVIRRFGVPDMLQMKKMIRAYEPAFYLGHFLDEPIWLETSSYKEMSGSHVNEGQKETLHSWGDYRFGLNMNDQKWEQMKKLGIVKFEGHEIVRQGDNYELRVYPSSKSFLHDTFYKCPNLKLLVLPRKMKLNTFVRDELSNVRMVEGKNEK